MLPFEVSVSVALAPRFIRYIQRTLPAFLWLRVPPPERLGDLTTVFIIPQPLDYVLLHEEASHPLRSLFCSGSPTPPPGVYSVRNSRIFDTLNILLTCYS